MPLVCSAWLHDQIATLRHGIFTYFKMFNQWKRTTKGISVPTPFFPLKWSKSEYGVSNALTQLHISLHNKIYSINGVNYFLFVHHSIMEWKIE